MFSGGRSGMGGYRGQMRGRTDGRFRRSFTKQSGIFDAYFMDFAPLNNFENQAIPTGYMMFQKVLGLI